MLTCSLLQSAGVGSGGIEIETSRSYDDARGTLVYVVYDTDATGAKTDTVLPPDNEAIIAATPAKIGQRWPLGLANGASLPGALCQSISVRRRSAFHAWVIVRYARARWGAANYETRQRTTTTQWIPRPKRRLAYIQPAGLLTGEKRIFDKSSEMLPRSVTTMYIRIPITKSLSGSQLDLVERNVGKIYYIGGVLNSGALVVHGLNVTPIGSVPYLLDGYSETINPAFGNSILTYRFMRTGFVPGEPGVVNPTTVGEAVPVPDLQPLEIWDEIDTGPVPVIVAVPIAQYPTGEGLPYVNLLG